MLVHVSGRFKKFVQGAGHGQRCAEQGTAAMAQLCQQQLPAAIPPRGPGSGGGVPGSPLLLLLFLLASSVRVCKGVPMPSQALEAEQELQLWKEIDDACSAYMSTDSQPQVPSTLEELCFLVMGFLQKPQGLDEKDNMKREDLQGTGGIQSRGYFFFRPRNGKRSVDFH
ncbi:neuromedin-U isoform X4 [Coturnix japonica]|uniref:neuromedin-U isoform X4 n=1 Tax=Coturnix japonica TaxID=93934 RepID=UPI0007770543|nr:neuromedin-U isoform X4 [Coturnix japonica]